MIVAAGRGVRMGEKYNKLLLPLGTSTIIECSLEPFLKHTGIQKIFLTVASQDRRFLKDLSLRKLSWLKEESVAKILFIMLY